VDFATALSKIMVRRLLLLFFLVSLWIALLASLLGFCSFHTALVRAFLASFLGIIAAASLHIGSGGDEHSANDYGQQSEALHVVLPFLTVNLSLLIFPPAAQIVFAQARACGSTKLY
jgi:nicotinamide riboside transporter PnuC